MFTRFAQFVNQGRTSRQTDKLYGVKSSLNDPRAKDGKKPDALVFSAARLNPSVTPLGANMVRDREDLHVTLPKGPANKSFMNSNGFHMLRGTSMKFNNHALKSRNVVFAWQVVS